jgi:ribosomal protein L14E/L6E/L27E
VLYLVTKVLDGRMVLVADGGTRTVAAPKRKNINHLILHQAAAPEELCGRLKRGERVDDGEISRAVRVLRASGKGEPG